VAAVEVSVHGRAMAAVEEDTRVEAAVAAEEEISVERCRRWWWRPT
jgi:hypothetical protein